MPHFNTVCCSLRGTCKHVAALCHSIIEKAARGENTTCTGQQQVWHAPSKKKTHPPEFLCDITIQKIQGKQHNKLANNLSTYITTKCTYG